MRDHVEAAAGPLALDSHRHATREQVYAYDPGRRLNDPGRRENDPGWCLGCGVHTQHTKTLFVPGCPLHQWMDPLE